jgi:CRP/FNR family transcriptional regulator, cyclic AMP receptor protein
MSTTTESLRSVPLFSELSDRDLKALAEVMQERSAEPGKELLTEGEGGVGFFVILEGTAIASVGGRETNTLRAGDHFGEMALIDGGARSASVQAGDGLRYAGMTAWNFRPFLRDHPDVAWALLKTLVGRVRQAEAR